MRSRELVAASVPVVVGVVGWGVWRGVVAWRGLVSSSGPPGPAGVGRDPLVDELAERLGELSARLGETVVADVSPGGHEVSVETVGGNADWKGLLFAALDLRGEGFGDVIRYLPRQVESGLLDEGWIVEKFNARFGGVTSPPFTVWTSRWVYFPVKRNVGVHVRESVGAVPLGVDVSDFPVEHVG